MAKIKAIDLKVGMELEDGAMVVEVGEVSGDTIEITLSSYDPDCGEVDYFPMVVPVSEEYDVLV
jgi:hypothetical protein